MSTLQTPTGRFVRQTPPPPSARLYRAKAPLRVSFAGGGTDVPPFPEREGGLVLSATINRYAYGALAPRADGGGGVWRTKRPVGVCSVLIAASRPVVVSRRPRAGAPPPGVRRRGSDGPGAAAPARAGGPTPAPRAAATRARG